jgi:hypothetical protein
MGLVGAGSATRLFLARMPSLHVRLGPVKGASFASARRLVATLRAGFAVPHYSALKFCPAIWICVPEAELEQVVRGLAPHLLPGVIVIVCGSYRCSASFQGLLEVGARVATLNAMDESWQSVFVAEGHREALRLLRSSVAEERRRLYELRPGGKREFLAGTEMATELLRPWIAAAVNLLSRAGIARPDAVLLAEVLAQRSLRSAARLGAQPLSSPAKEKLRFALGQRVPGMPSPREAKLYAEGLRLALEYFERDAKKVKAATNNG